MKTINEKQKKIIVIGIIVIILMSLFPPWTHTKKFRGGVSIQGPAGYSFIFTPPKKTNQEISYGFRLDVIRLFVQWIIVLMATGFGVFVTSTANKCKQSHTIGNEVYRDTIDYVVKSENRRKKQKVKSNEQIKIETESKNEKNDYSNTIMVESKKSLEMHMGKRILLCFLAWLVSHFSLHIGYAFFTQNPPVGFIALINICVVGLVFFLTRNKNKAKDLPTIAQGVFILYQMNSKLKKLHAILDRLIQMVYKLFILTGTGYTYAISRHNTSHCKP